MKLWLIVQNFLGIFFQIVSHSRSQDGTWLNPEKLRQMLTGLEASPAGQYPSGFLKLFKNIFKEKQNRFVFIKLKENVISSVQTHWCLWCLC